MKPSCFYFKCLLVAWSLHFAISVLRDSKLLIISCDGFRYDYYDYFKPPNMVKFANGGVRARLGMLASFPTKTFPNHYTLATGLYPESHGVVDNVFWDEAFNETFFNNKTDSKWFEGGIPIWISGRLQGLKTATFFWVGSESELQGTRPNFYKKFNKSVPWNERVDTVIDWFEKEDVSFVALYFEEPDDAGHKFGSFSEGVRSQIQKLDEIFGYLLQKLETKGLLNKVDIILTSDHGMTNVSVTPQENLILNQHLTNQDYIFAIQTGPVASIFPREGKAIEVRDKLNKVTPNVRVYLKEDIPAEFHYRNNRRIAPLIAVGNEGYQTMVAAEDLNKTGKIGNHGYSNSLPSMRPFFIASGPHFRKGILVEPFENVNVYLLMCQILGITPNANNGSIEIVRQMVADDSTSLSNNDNKLYCVFLTLLSYFTCFSFTTLFYR